LGVGLNLGCLPPEITSFATSLATLGAPDENREALLRDLLDELSRRLRDLVDQGGQARVVLELNRHDGLRGRRVSVGGVAGVASGIDPAGGLLITDERGAVHNLRSGHVNLA
jgi:biotin-(acetyl-CoA carboxylase) ligase